MSITVPDQLKRSVIMSAALEEFKKGLFALSVFNPVYKGTPLEGTNKIRVPYFPNETSESKVWDEDTGYDLSDTYGQGFREVEISKRVYQPLSFTSADVADQPYLGLEEIGRAKGRKLVEDVFADILSGVTAANFGAAAFTGAVESFDFSEVNNIGLVCDEADWMDEGRKMILKSSYYRSLVADLADAQAYGSPSAVQNGMLQDVSGFDIMKTNAIPDNGENLVGFAVLPSSLLIGFAPTPPADTTNVVDYESLVDAETGICLEYREWFNPIKDRVESVIESRFGFGKGEGNALKRIVSA